MQSTLKTLPAVQFLVRYGVYGRDALFLLLAAVVVFLYVDTAGTGFPLDDSWIHQVYSRNLADRGEWAFVPGEPSGASTSPLYTVLLAVGYALNVPYAVWTHGIGALALAAAGMIGARLADRMADSRLLGLFAGLALILAWHLVWAASSGMETMLFSTFTLAMVYVTLKPVGTRYAVPLRVNRDGVLFGVTAALMTMTRPEGILLAGICGGVLTGYWMIRERPGMTNVLAPTGLPVWLVSAGIAFLVVITPYLVLNLHLSGGLLPSTADAKYLQHAPLLQRPFLERLWNMTLPLIAGGQIMLVPGVVYVIGVAIRARRRMPLHTLIVAISLLWVVGLIVLYALRLPAPYQHGRYVIPVLPLWIVLGVVGTYNLVLRAQDNAIGRVFTRALAMAAALVFLYMTYMGVGIYRRDVQIINEEMVRAARWIAENIPADELLAVHDIGAVGYFAPRPILDIAGLVTADVVSRIGDDGALWQFMRDREAQYLMAFPDQIPGRDPSDPRLCEVYRSDGRASVLAGGGKMVVYALAWDGGCP